MAIPAGLIMKRFGYKFGIIVGLGLFALGAFLFYPAATFGTFIPFLIALFVIACGLACLETAANPYSTVLGPKESAPQRINFSQSFNGLGWILGPLIGGLLIFGAEKTGEADKFNSLLTPYMLIGAIVLVVAVAFMFTTLPDIKEEVAGGAFCPPIMGAIADHLKMATGFLIPMFCFAFISYFGIIGYRKFIKEVS